MRNLYLRSFVMTGRCLNGFDLLSSSEAPASLDQRRCTRWLKVQQPPPRICRLSRFPRHIGALVCTHQGRTRPAIRRFGIRSRLWHNYAHDIDRHHIQGTGLPQRNWHDDSAARLARNVQPCVSRSRRHGYSAAGYFCGPRAFRPLAAAATRCPVLHHAAEASTLL